MVAGQESQTEVSDTQSTVGFAEILANSHFQMACMRPIYLAPSAWLEHLPFAFWLISQQRPQSLVELGAHYGCSYFAFCQAIEKLSLNTRSYAVDNWHGDEHSGFYGDEVYEAVSTHNDELYSRFSRLVRSTFDEASGHFADKSIDILHIDGFHTFSAVQHDVETWMPKLSERALLLLHDTNVRERGFGVSLVLDSLRATYPVFEFDHGHGLGVVGIGSIREPGIQHLFDIADQAGHRLRFANFFARLGRSCADAYTVRKLRAQIATTARSLKAQPLKTDEGRGDATTKE